MRLGLAANRLHHARPDAVGRTFDARTLAFGLAAARLKHSVPGDFNLVGESDVTALVESGRLDVRR